MRTSLRGAVATLLTIATGLVVAVGPVSTPSAVADPYTGSVQTRCAIGTPTISSADPRPVVEVTVGVVGNTRPTGLVRVTYAHDSRPMRTQDARYTGHTVRLTGPALTDRGRYAVHVRYQPHPGAMYRSCTASARVMRVGTDVSPADGHQNHVGPTGVKDASGQRGGHGTQTGTDTGGGTNGGTESAVDTTSATPAGQGRGHGLLPNTGSPVSLGLLTLAVGLVVTGSAMMSGRLRRRRQRRRLSW